MNGQFSDNANRSFIRNIPIQIDNICSTQGEFTPRWFRFEDDEHLIHYIKVLQIISKKDINYVGIKMIQYICRTADEEDPERVHLVELRYNIMSHRWYFFQML